LHWKLDVALREDACRIRCGDAAEIFSKIRHVALNLLNKDQTFKTGIKKSKKEQEKVKAIYLQFLQGRPFRNLPMTIG
jgi:hypothetical protein